MKFLIVYNWITLPFQQASTLADDTVYRSKQNSAPQLTPHSSSADLSNGTKTKLTSTDSKGSKKQTQSHRQPGKESLNKGHEKDVGTTLGEEMVESDGLEERKMSLSTTDSDLVSWSVAVIWVHHLRGLTSSLPLAGKSRFFVCLSNLLIQQ